MTESRAYTAEEARRIFLRHLRDLARYWASLPDVDPVTGCQRTTLDRCEGVVLSILSTIDGVFMGMPAMDVVMSPHPDDRQFFSDEGLLWFEPGTVISDVMLHECWYRNEGVPEEVPDD